jgi:hypothetical protein
MRSKGGVEEWWSEGLILEGCDDDGEDGGVSVPHGEA